MIKKPASPETIKQFELLKQELMTWRKNPKKSRIIPKQLRNLAVATMAAGISITQLQTLGLSYTQVKEWQATSSKAPSNPTLAITFSEVENPLTLNGVTCQFKHPNGVLLDVSLNNVEQATTVIKTFIGA